jgi:cystathionine beta-lyase/cystathionine gamma-synthase
MTDKKNDRAQWHESTRITHSPRVEIHPENRPVVPPLYLTGKFSIASGVPMSEQFFYTRVSNPTLRELELTLSEIQKKEETIVFASGVAAISGTLLSLLGQGDHVIIFREMYRPGRILVRDILPRFGITHSVLKLSDIANWEKHITDKTKLVYFESPSNPHLQIADIEKIVSIAKKRGVTTLLDGTFAGLHQHREYDIDLVIHSLTKFANGHGDVIAGSVSGKSDLIKTIRQLSITLGATLDPHAAYLISRGLKTYSMRYQRHSQSSMEIASRLLKHPKIKKVYYPGLAHHEGSELAKKQMQDMGGVIAFEVDPSCGDALEICHRVKLINFTASVGSIESLLCPTLMFFGDDLPEGDRQEMGLNKYSLRLSVGLEHPDDILQDLFSALEKK